MDPFLLNSRSSGSSSSDGRRNSPEAQPGRWAPPPRESSRNVSEETEGPAPSGERQIVTESMQRDLRSPRRCRELIVRLIRSQEPGAERPLHPAGRPCQGTLHFYRCRHTIRENTELCCAYCHFPQRRVQKEWRECRICARMLYDMHLFVVLVWDHWVWDCLSADLPEDEELIDSLYHWIEAVLRPRFPEETWIRFNRLGVGKFIYSVWKQVCEDYRLNPRLLRGPIEEFDLLEALTTTEQRLGAMATTEQRPEAAATTAEQIEEETYVDDEEEEDDAYAADGSDWPLPPGNDWELPPAEETVPAGGERTISFNYRRAELAIALFQERMSRPDDPSLSRTSRWLTNYARLSETAQETISNHVWENQAPPEVMTEEAIEGTINGLLVDPGDQNNEQLWLAIRAHLLDPDYEMTLVDGIIDAFGPQFQPSARIAARIRDDIRDDRFHPHRRLTREQLLNIHRSLRELDENSLPWGAEYRLVHWRELLRDDPGFRPHYRQALPDPDLELRELRTDEIDQIEARLPEQYRLPHRPRDVAQFGPWQGRPAEELQVYRAVQGLSPSLEMRDPSNSTSS